MQVVCLGIGRGGGGIQRCSLSATLRGCKETFWDFSFSFFLLNKGDRGWVETRQDSFGEPPREESPKSGGRAGPWEARMEEETASAGANHLVRYFVVTGLVKFFLNSN